MCALLKTKLELRPIDVLSNMGLHILHHLYEASNLFSYIEAIKLEIEINIVLQSAGLDV